MKQQKSSESTSELFMTGFSLDALPAASDLIGIVTGLSSPSQPCSSSASAGSSDWLTSPTNPSLRFQSDGRRSLTEENDEFKHLRSRGLEPPTSDCWLWQGLIEKNGYGGLTIATGKRGGKKGWAHRMIYEMMAGPIPEGLELDHLCRNRSCVRPDHMQPVSTQENVLRGLNFAAYHARRTHCPRGHEYAGSNLRVYKKMRFCRQCKRELNRGYYKKKAQRAKAL